MRRRDPRRRGDQVRDPLHRAAGKSAAPSGRGNSVSVDGSLPSSGRLPATRPHRSLFVKYVVTLFVAVVVPLVLGAISEAWFGYQDRRVHLNELLLAEARSATDRIQTFIVGIRNQLGFVVQLPWMTNYIGSMRCACCGRCPRSPRSRCSTKPAPNAPSYPD